jgi:hypothetical protein
MHLAPLPFASRFPFPFNHSARSLIPRKYPTSNNPIASSIPALVLNHKRKFDEFVENPPSRDGFYRNLTYLQETKARFTPSRSAIDVAVACSTEPSLFASVTRSIFVPINVKAGAPSPRVLNSDRKRFSSSRARSNDACSTTENTIMIISMLWLKRQKRLNLHLCENGATDSGIFARNFEYTYMNLLYVVSGSPSVGCSPSSHVSAISRRTGELSTEKRLRYLNNKEKKGQAE